MEIKKVRLDVPPVEAVQITRGNIAEAAVWAGGILAEYRDERSDLQIKIVIPTETGLIEGESYYVGDWLIRNPQTPGLVSSLDSDMFRKVYTETEPVSPSELAEIIEQVMNTPSRSVRSLSQEAAARVFDRIQQKAGKKIRCLQCGVDKNASEMAARVDGDPSSMCKGCEQERIAEINTYKRNASNKIRERLGGN